MISNNSCTDINCNGINCEWDNEQANKFDKPSTRTVQFEDVIINDQNVEQGWFYWLQQKTKDSATEGERVQFGCETHCHLFDKTGRMIGWRVYLP